MNTQDYTQYLSSSTADSNPTTLNQTAEALVHYWLHGHEGMDQLASLMNQLITAIYPDGCHADSRLRGNEPEIRNETLLLLLNQYLMRKPLLDALASGALPMIASELKTTLSAAWWAASRTKEKAMRRHAREITVDEATWNTLTATVEDKSESRILDKDLQLEFTRFAIADAVKTGKISTRTAEVFMAYLDGMGALTMSAVAKNLGITPQAVAQHVATCGPHIRNYIRQLGYEI